MSRLPPNLRHATASDVLLFNGNKSSTSCPFGISRVVLRATWHHEIPALLGDRNARALLAWHLQCSGLMRCHLPASQCSPVLGVWLGELMVCS